MNDLTKDEAYSLCDFLDTALIPYIRDDPDVDSVEWLMNMMNAYQKLGRFSEYRGMTVDFRQEQEAAKT